MGRKPKYARTDIDGVLIIDKPSGPTSHDMVAAARRVLKAKAGHTGTLDPQATGVLPLVVGQATRLAQFMQEHDKQYRALIRLGRSTDTYDGEGRVTEEHPVPNLSDEQVEEVLQRFRGEIEQRAPLYSAVKVKGKKLYEYARKGEEAQRPLRRVRIDRLRLLDRQDSAWTLLIDCGPGTYVRSLAHDIGRQLECGAYLESLCRTRSGPFALERAIAPQDIEAGWRQALIPMEELLPSMTRIDLDDAGLGRRILNGGAVVVPGVQQGMCRVFSRGRLLAVAHSDGVSLQPKIVFKPSPPGDAKPASDSSRPEAGGEHSDQDPL